MVLGDVLEPTPSLQEAPKGPTTATHKTNIQHPRNLGLKVSTGRSDIAYDNRCMCKTSAQLTAKGTAHLIGSLTTQNYNQDPFVKIQNHKMIHNSMILLRRLGLYIAGEKLLS
jgi:hypothetical protein